MAEFLLSWSDLSLTVTAVDSSDTTEDAAVAQDTSRQLKVLDGISGYARGGRLLAVMGSSGSGKTSLLDVLCDRITDGEISGEIKLNGETLRHNGRNEQFSYVPQLDHLLNTATIKETLETAALLKSESITQERLKAEIDEILSDMKLSHRESFFIGGGDVRGISGGEKRRVSIAQELICSSSTVLLLDEPTTGLDSNTAEIVMKCILEVARKKKAIVICTIHQPNSAITSLFDDLLLLSHGKCIYFGPYADSITAFATAGFQCPMYSNPTDYFLSLVDNPDTYEVLQLNQKKRYQTLLESVVNSGSNNSSNNANISSNEGIALEETRMRPTGKYKTSMLYQAYILTIRASRQWMRDPAMFASELIQYIFLALFLGGMYYQTDKIKYIEGAVFNRMSALFFLISVLVFTPPLTVLTSFALEKPLFCKERRDGMYRASSWLLAKTTVTWPVEAVFCLVFSAITYFMVGFQPEAGKFFIHFAILLIFQLISESMGLMFAVLCGSPVYAIVWLSLVLIVMLSLSGFLTYSMPIYYQWIMDSNVFYFTIQALISNEFNGLYFDVGGLKIPADEFLPPLMKPKRSISECVGILIGILALLRLLTWLLLVLMNKRNKLSWVLSKVTFNLYPSHSPYVSLDKKEEKSDIASLDRKEEKNDIELATKQ